MKGFEFYLGGDLQGALSRTCQGGGALGTRGVFSSLGRLQSAHEVGMFQFERQRRLEGNPRSIAAQVAAVAHLR